MQILSEALPGSQSFVGRASPKSRKKNHFLPLAKKVILKKVPSTLSL